VEYEKQQLRLNFGADSRYTDNDVFIAGEQLILNTFDRPRYVEAEVSPTVYTVTGDRQNRLDLISDDYYGTTNLWWLIAWANDILDPFVGITAGRLLTIPKQSEIWNK